MIIHNVCRRLNASEAAASHCVVGIDWIAPRTISDTFAMTGNATSYEGIRGRCRDCGYPLRGLAEQLTSLCLCLFVSLRNRIAQRR